MTAPIGSFFACASAQNGSSRETKSSSMWSRASGMKPGLTALTTAYAALIARPESPPFESTSSWTSEAQSATTFGRLPGTSRMSFSVGMGGNLHHTTAAWYASAMGRLLPSPRAALSVLTALNLLNYLDRFLPFAVLPALSASLHLSDARAGLLQTLFMGSYMLVSPIAGWLGDRRSRFGIAAIGVLIWSAATFGSGLAPGFLALAIARALTGVGEASYVVVTPSLLSD